MKNNYTVHKYNPANYDFYKPILHHLKSIPKFKDINFIEDISKNFSPLDYFDIEKAIYKYIKTDEFLNLYQKFNYEVVTPICSKKFKVQNIPAVRVSLPGKRSVNFHNDCWYGHGKYIENFWIPLTNVRGNQALAFLDKIENKKAIDYFILNDLSLIEIQKYCEKKAKLVELNYGEFLHFPTSAIHGTFTNNTKDVRISFDFRICHDEDRGFKSHDFFLDIDQLICSKDKSLNKSNLKKTAISYVSQRNFSGGFLVSQTIQHDANISYCQKKNLTIITHETELMGFEKLINLEDIFFGNFKGLTKDVVIFSDKLINLKNIKNKKIIDTALDQGFTIHFANEGYILQKDSNEK